ncbi:MULTISPECIES: hypothetical protein [Burkholderia]|nr:MULTISPECIES: hypothetical protein [Burkholderia]MDC6133633.1 hypothetical protein [Burkholderia gladioli]MDN7723488.1 hypothetical protein [Burkholderia gladioli]MDN7740622.1 hypothetical protein [Burkholderia gladioli]MDN7806511.1 hypothetical protein [Burkholderia gladioli]MDN7920141.1 hypothetical protein [Burkholderia gladioli]
MTIHPVNPPPAMSRTREFAAFLSIALLAAGALAASPTPSASSASSVPVVSATLSAKPSAPVMMVHFTFYERDLPRLRQLEQSLRVKIERAHAGELGETELHLDGNDGYLYMYGPDADRLYALVGPMLRASRLMGGAEVTQWRGVDSRHFALHPAAGG